MSFSMFEMAHGTFVPMLGTLSELLDKGADDNALADARLAPDMYPLAVQVKLACDHAKEGTARLIDEEAPRFENDEQTLDDLKLRIQKTIAWIETKSAGAFEGSANRKVTMQPQGTLTLEMKGYEYLRDWVLPNFYFHVVTAYDILRANGVALGKQDYLAHLRTAVRSKP